MSVKRIPPILYSKTGVFRGISIFLILFLIFVPKYRLWVHVGTPSARRFQRVPTINVLSKCIKNIDFFFPIFNVSIFTAEKILCVLNGQVFVMLPENLPKLLYLIY